MIILKICMWAGLLMVGIIGLVLNNKEVEEEVFEEEETITKKVKWTYMELFVLMYGVEFYRDESLDDDFIQALADITTRSEGSVLAKVKRIRNINNENVSITKAELKIQKRLKDFQTDHMEILDLEFERYVGFLLVEKSKAQNALEST